MRHATTDSIVSQMVDYHVADSNLDAAFAALADPTRRDVVGRLAVLPLGPAVPVSTLAAHHPMSLQAVIKHLLVPERAGLISCHKSGRARRCHLLQSPLRELSAWVEAHRSFWEGQFDALERFLAVPEAESDVPRGDEA